MPLLNDIHSIIVPATAPNFSAHSYTEVYAGADDVIAINGVAFQIGNGSSIKIKVGSVSGGTKCVLLGENLNNRYESPIFM
jgi:hypothetical protein